MNVLVEIRKRRVALGVPLGELARAVGRSDATLSRIERGKIRPSYELVQRILKYLEEQEGLATPRLTVRDIMNRTVVTVDSSATLHVAAQRMEGGAFSQLPVLQRRPGGRLPLRRSPAPSPRPSAGSTDPGSGDPRAGLSAGG